MSNNPSNGNDKVKKVRGNPNIREISKNTQFKKGHIPTRTRKGCPNKPIVIDKNVILLAMNTHPKTGKAMSLREITMHMSKRIYGDSKAMIEALHYLLGKPVEQIQQDIRTIHIVTDEREGIEGKGELVIDTAPNALNTQMPNAPPDISGVEIDNTHKDISPKGVSTSVDISGNKANKIPEEGEE